MSSVGEIIRLPYLPNEMWAEIFSHLSLCDRKSIRLSCRHFYDIVNCARFHQNEKLVIYGDVDANEIEEMCHSRRKMWTIELNRLQPEDTHIVRIFIMHNLRIRSLTFVNCELAPGTFLEIIEYSVQLRHVTLIFDSFVEIESLKNVLNDVRVLRDNGFLCHEVRSVSLEMELSSELSWLGSLFNVCDDFCLFRAIFPNIGHVKVSTSLGSEFDDVIDANPLPVYFVANLHAKLELFVARRCESERHRILEDGEKRNLCPDHKLFVDTWLPKTNELFEKMRRCAELMQQNVELMPQFAELLRLDVAGLESMSGLYSRHAIMKFSL